MNRYPITHFERCQKVGMIDIIKEMEGQYGEFKDFPYFRNLIERDTELGDIIQSCSGNINLGARVFFHLARFNRQRKVYRFSTNLCEALFRTNFGKIIGNEVQSPYESFYIVMDKSPLSAVDEKGKVFYLDGMYINLQNEIYGHRSIRFLSVTNGPQDDNEYADMNFFGQVILDENVTIDENIENMQKSMRQDDRNHITEDDYRRFNVISRMAINLCLYLTSKDIDCIPVTPDNINERINRSGSKKASKLLRMADRSTSIPFIYVGTKVSRVNGGERTNGWSLSYQFNVSGHWRHQWKGSEKNGTKHQERIFIKDFKKGPDAAELINKQYVVK